MTHEPDKPIAGFYQMRLVSGGVPVAVRIWHGPPICPHTGEPLDRSWRWQALIDGRVADDVYVAWPYCSGEPIPESEYRFLLARALWARRYARREPYANPRQPVDWNFTKAV